jgi:hypothetical protein
VLFGADSATFWRVQSLTISQMGLILPIYVRVRSRVMAWMAITTEAQASSHVSAAVLIGSVTGGAIALALLAAGIVFMVRSGRWDAPDGPDTVAETTQVLQPEKPTTDNVADGIAPAVYDKEAFRG